MLQAHTATSSVSCVRSECSASPQGFLEAIRVQRERGAAIAKQLHGKVFTTPGELHRREPEVPYFQAVLTGWIGPAPWNRARIGKAIAQFNRPASAPRLWSGRAGTACLLVQQVEGRESRKTSWRHPAQGEGGRWGWSPAGFGMSLYDKSGDRKLRIVWPPSKRFPGPPDFHSSPARSVEDVRRPVPVGTNRTPSIRTGAERHPACRRKPQPVGRHHSSIRFAATGYRTGA